MVHGIDASYVASFTNWKSMNYYVKKGEKGIGIYTPAPYRVKDEKSGEEKEHLFFKVKFVFTDTQVEPMRPDVPPFQPFLHRLQEIVKRSLIISLKSYNGTGLHSWKRKHVDKVIAQKDESASSQDSTAKIDF